MDDDTTDEQEQAQEETEPNPAGGMPEHEQAEEPGPPVAADADGERIREMGAGM